MSMSNSTSIAIGIDLGTTYSCVAAWHQNRVEVIANDQGNRTTPSFVCFAGEDRLVGDAAKSQAHAFPETTIFDAKRLIGRAASDPEVVADATHWPFKVKGDGSQCLIEIPGARDFSPVEISAMVLARMRETAEAFFGGAEVRKAVITVPAYFNDAQRQATRDAGTIAGLEVLRILSEPTAAAVAYGFDAAAAEGTTAKKTVLIFDLGGGTFDVSVLSIQDGVFDVLATAGDTHLGGEDFDARMLDFCLREFVRKQRAGFTETEVRGSARALHRLRTACERAKRTLSSATSATVEVDGFWAGQDLRVQVTRARFEELNAELFRKCMLPVEQALRDSKRSKEQIDEVVLVGGSTRIPKIRTLLSEFFGGRELNQSVHPDEAVACGAAMQAAVLTGAIRRDAETGAGALVLVDVTPLSLGLETAGGAMTSLIPRNTSIPVTVTKTFSTFSDRQTGVTVKVFQGERALTKDNRLLGRFDLMGIPPLPRGIPQIDVKFSVDADGILSVSASEKSLGVSQDVCIQSDQARASAADIERMLKDAEAFRAQDEDARARLRAAGELERYLFDVRASLQQALACPSLAHLAEGAETRLRGALNDVGAAEEWLADASSGRPVSDVEARMHALEVRIAAAFALAEPEPEPEPEPVAEAEAEAEASSSEPVAETSA